jgi:mono/diheme cytochrome c family protein
MTSTSIPRTRRRFVLVLPALALALGALFAAGCGSGSVGYTKGTGDRAAGKTLFVAKCGSCHTLADAGTQGQIGPNLDYAFYASRRDGLGESTFVQVVRGQIAYPISHTSTGAPGMPKNLVNSQQANDIASYVGAVAGVKNPSLPTAAPPPAATTPATTTPATTTPSAGGGAAGNVAAGKTVFTTAGCTGCHTLKDAGSTGSVGPNLDDAKPDAALVKERVTNGKSPMPSFKGQLTDKQIADVAAYVSSVAGK